MCTLKKFDKEAYSQIAEKYDQIPDKVYFNKGVWKIELTDQYIIAYMALYLNK